MIKNFIWHLFSDKSPLNGAVAVGCGAFVMMCIFAIADIATGLLQKDLVVSDTIYHSFVAIVFAAFFKSLYENIKGNKNIENEQ
jgi:hypothetical protein